MELKNNESPIPKTRRPLTDLVGTKVGRLSVIKPLRYEGKSGRLIVFCRCECGTEKEILAQSLRSGLTLSCGCLNKEILSSMHTRRTHGKCGTAIYRTWRNMRTRCENPDIKEYKHYGGRGISVCDRWKKFENFYSDMGECPSKNHSIDRKNVDGDYTPENCRWATSEDQQNNKRNNVILTLGEETRTLAQWAKKLGMLQSTLWARLESGVPVKIALTVSTLPRNYNKPLRFKTRSDIPRTNRP